MRGGRDRPRRVDHPARPRHTQPHHRPGGAPRSPRHQADLRSARRRRWHRPRTRGAQRVRPQDAAPEVPAGRPGHQRLQPGNRRDRLHPPGGERGQRPHVHHDAPRARGGDGHGAHRRDVGRRRRGAQPAGPQRYGSAAVELHEHHHRSSAARRRRWARRGARRHHGQRPQRAARQRVRRDAELHPLRCVPQRVPRVPADRWSRVRVGLLGPDGCGAHAPARREGAPRGVGGGQRVDAVRGLHGRLPREHPVAGPAAGQSSSSRRDGGGPGRAGGMVGLGRCVEPRADLRGGDEGGVHRRTVAR